MYQFKTMVMQNLLQPDSMKKLYTSLYQKHKIDLKLGIVFVKPDVVKQHTLQGPASLFEFLT